MTRLPCEALVGPLMILVAVGSAWAQAAPEWQRVFADETLVIDARSKPGSNIKELNAEGAIKAPPHVVRAVIADVTHYPASCLREEQ